MRTASIFILISIFFSCTSWAVETFELALPDQSSNSDGFVNSLQGELESAPSRPSRASTRAAVEAEPGPSAYESAFTSFRSKKTSDEEQAEQAEAWHSSQSKPDNFDIESLSYSAPQATEVQSGMPSEASSSRVSAKDRKALILRTISNNYSELKSCYHEGLRKNSGMKGKVVMGWRMDPQGRVSAAEVQMSQLQSKQVEKCLVERVSNWRFPSQAKLQGSKDRMSYTFQFLPEN